jgi:GNAT superfamily N-acetyltransferase
VADQPVSEFRIAPATAADVPLILRLIKGLADYEKLTQEVVATEEGLHAALFGPRPFAEVVIGYVGTEPVGFALFFHNFSTFRGAPGIYLEDLFVEPQWRGQGFGRRLIAHLAALAVTRACHRLEWAVLDWNAPAIGFYRGLGATAMDDWSIFRLTGRALHDLAGTV